MTIKKAIKESKKGLLDSLYRLLFIREEKIDDNLKLEIDNMVDKIYIMYFKLTCIEEKL